MADEPGTLATLGETFGRAGISMEGGGMWVVDGRGTAHFLIADGAPARAALEPTGIIVTAVREVIGPDLAQEVPGQQGKRARQMADTGVIIEVL